MTMAKKLCWLVLFVILELVSNLAYGQAPLSPKHKKWLEEEVPYIVTTKERDVFRKLETDELRDRFIEEFWKQRDPTPGTPRNEFKEEHYRRIEYANMTFGRGTPFQGWRTERGRIYIILGPPVDVQRIVSSDAYPMELWYYKGNPGLGQAPYYRLLFYQKYGAGDYILYNPIANSPKELVGNPGKYRKQSGTATPDDWDEADQNAYQVLRQTVSPEVASATLSMIPGNDSLQVRIPSSILLAEVQKYPQKKVDDAYALDFLNHKATVEVSYSVHFIGNRTAVSVLTSPSGLYFLHYVIVPETLSMDTYQDRYVADLRTTLRLSDTTGKTVFQQEKLIPIEMRKDELKAVENSSFQFYDAVPVIPGNYLLNILMENTMTIPAEPGLWMSPLVPSRKVGEDPSQGGNGRAYQIGKYQLYPCLNSTFQTKDTAYFFLQLHGLSGDLRETGVLVYSIMKGDQVLRSSRKNVADSENGRDFLAEFPLDKFVPGSYALKSALQDKDGREIVSQTLGFTVSDKAIPGTWVFAQENPPENDPSYSYSLGIQYLNTGDAAKARDELAKAYKKKADSVEYAVGYARALLATEDPAKAKGFLLPFGKKGSADFDLYAVLGTACQDTGDYQEAITWLQKALSYKGNVVEILNRLGACFLQIGDKDQALKAWKKSLEVKPDQENIKKLIEKIRELPAGSWSNSK
jgi:GWxTD domain-containing protein